VAGECWRAGYAVVVVNILLISPGIEGATIDFLAPMEDFTLLLHALGRNSMKKQKRRIVPLVGRVVRGPGALAKPVRTNSSRNSLLGAANLTTYIALHDWEEKERTALGYHLTDGLRGDEI